MTNNKNEKIIDKNEKIIGSISQLKVIFLKMGVIVLDGLLKIINNLLWIILIFLTGFILHIFYIYIIDPNNFDFKKIILDGSLILFLMAFTSSIFIDDVIFGNYIKNTKNTSFRIGLLGFFLIFIFSTCGITLMLGKTLQSELQKVVEYEGILEYEFIFALNMTLLIVTVIFAVVTRHLSHKNDNTRW